MDRAEVEAVEAALYPILVAVAKGDSIIALVDHAAHEAIAALDAVRRSPDAVRERAEQVARRDAELKREVDEAIAAMDDGGGAVIDRTERIRVHTRHPHNGDLQAIWYVDTATPTAELLSTVAQLQGAFDRLWVAYVEAVGEPPVDNS